MITKTSIRDQRWADRSHGERFASGRIGLTPADNDSGIGCAAFRVPSGRCAFPRHAHLANDEAIYVLSGGGTLSIGDQEFEMAEGDFVLLPRGSDYPHVLVNDGNDDLIYLCISTMNMPDVVHYPDSDKLGVIENNFWGQGTDAPKVSGFYARNPVDYYEGEE